MIRVLTNGGRRFYGIFQNKSGTRFEVEIEADSIVDAATIFSSLEGIFGSANPASIVSISTESQVAAISIDFSAGRLDREFLQAIGIESDAAKSQSAIERDVLVDPRVAAQIAREEAEGQVQN